MKQEEIERIIRTSVGAEITVFDDGGTALDREDGPCLTVEIRGVKKAAAEIAKLFEEEFAEAISKALDSYIIRLDAKEAQLAEMRGALETVLRLADRLHTRDDEPSLALATRLHVIAHQALSAAPEVLWSGEANLGHWTSEPNKVQLTAIMTEIGGGNLLGKIGKDGQQVKVIVVAVNQKQLTNESKAKTVDKEGED